MSWLTLANYPPLSATIANEATLIDHWDDDTLFSQYLRSAPEPTEVVEFGRLDARVRCVRGRIRELNRLRKQVEPRKIVSLDGEVAKEKFRRKVLGWQLFLVNELPPELLVEIFRYVVLSTHVMFGEPLQKLRLTWVCKHFRELALADGLLWGRIVFNDPAPWTRSLTFLQRAKEAPLDLCLDDSAEGVPNFTHNQVMYLGQRFRVKAHNIRSLVVSLNDWIGPWFILKLFANVSAPLLDYFQLDRGWEPYLWTTTAFPDPDSRAPIPFCNNDAPNIARLTLNGISVKWCTIHTGKLRTLDIRRLAPDVCPTTAEFRALISAPNLTKLHLHAAAPLLPPGGQPRLPPVYTAKLRELRLGDMTCDAAMNVLYSIHAPDVRIFALSKLGGMDYTPLFEMLTRRFAKVEILTLANVQVEDTVQARAHLITWVDMMIGLRVFRVEGLSTYAILKILVTDPWPYRSPAHLFRQGPAPISLVLKMNLIAPELHTLVVNEIAPRDLVDIVAHRERDGFALSIVTVPEPVWQRWTPAERAPLAFLGNRLRLAFNYPHNISKEEARIRAEMDQDFRDIYGIPSGSG